MGGKNSWPWKGPIFSKDARPRVSLLEAGVLRDGFISFGHSELGQDWRQNESDGGLYVPTRDGRTLVVANQEWGLRSYPLENVVGKSVHDAHGLARDAGVRMDRF